VPSRRLGVFWQKVSFWRFFFFFGGKKKHLKSLAKPYQSLFGVLNMVDKIVTACVGVGSSKPTASLVAAAEHGYRTVLYEYLAEKENIVLPVLRAFFKPQEVFAVFAQILGTAPRLVFGSLAHHLPGGEEGVAAFNARALVTSRWRFTSSDTTKARGGVQGESGVATGSAALWKRRVGWKKQNRFRKAERVGAN